MDTINLSAPLISLKTEEVGAHFILKPVNPTVNKRHSFADGFFPN